VKPIIFIRVPQTGSFSCKSNSSSRERFRAKTRFEAQGRCLSKPLSKEKDIKWETRYQNKTTVTISLGKIERIAYISERILLNNGQFLFGRDVANLNYDRNGK